MAAPYQLTEFVSRPSPGTLGKPIVIRSNFFHITRLPDVNVHHYDVTITPDVPPPVNRRIFKQLIDVHGHTDLGGSRPVFDGRKNIFAPRAFPFESRSFDIILPEDAPRPGQPQRLPPRGFKVKVKKAAEINLEELHRFLQGKSQMTNNIQTAIMALDVLIRHQPAMLYSSVGRSFFTPDGAMPLYGGIEVWNGFYQSARPAMGRMLINLDIAATAYWQSGSLLELAVKILDQRSIADKTMFMKDEAKTNVASYFYETYGRRLQYPFMPCVITGRDVFLPMEICSVIE
ncbi:hypothetical protein BGZ54_002214, partial [Gamsiella multidivaricata]